MSRKFEMYLTEVEIIIINNYRRTLPIGKIHIEALVETISKESSSHLSAEIIPIKEHAQ